MEEENELVDTTCITIDYQSSFCLIVYRLQVIITTMIGFVHLDTLYHHLHILSFLALSELPRDNTVYVHLQNPLQQGA